MRIAWLCIGLIVSMITGVSAQKLKDEELNCKTRNKAAGDELANTKTLYMSRSNTEEEAKTRGKKIRFPLRFLFVSDHLENKESYINKSKLSIEKLNAGFSSTNLEFYLDNVEMLHSIIKVEDLHVNDYALYNEFSSANDISNTISVYVFDYETHLCVTTPTSISCGRTSGFSYILSNKTSSVVLSNFDITDDKVLVHEMGHFFGLYHTFEEDMFGKDNFVEDCNVAGDCICDTPPDPGSVYEVYVNYSQCGMIDFYHENGHRYEPLIDNYMGYYKPCYLKTYTFSNGQTQLLNMSAKSDLRKRFGR
jgi:hypothetical protein